MKKIFFIFVILFNFNIKTTAGEISGFPVITDGDTIKILNNRIRLHGIDAPEKKQRCIKKSKNYKCGSVATIELTKKINKNLVKS